MEEAKYILPLSIQLGPADDLFGAEMAEKFRLLQGYGLSGVELNITDMDKTDPAKLKQYLSEFGLKMTMFASGAQAKKHNLSLSSEDQGVRKAAVEKCREIIAYASQIGSGVIFGFMKGTAGFDKTKANACFKESIAALAPDALKYKVCLLTEATNHYEATIANTVAEAVDLIKDLNNPYLKVLPDTYHMNIEERSSWGTLVKYKDYYNNFHISDNNRFFPGLGALDFAAVVRFLKEIGYEGPVAIEGNIKYDFARDLEISVGALKPALREV